MLLGQPLVGAPAGVVLEKELQPRSLWARGRGRRACRPGAVRAGRLPRLPWERVQMWNFLISAPCPFSGSVCFHQCCEVPRITAQGWVLKTLPGLPTCLLTPLRFSISWGILSRSFQRKALIFSYPNHMNSSTEKQRSWENRGLRNVWGTVCFCGSRGLWSLLYFLLRTRVPRWGLYADLILNQKYHQMDHWS